MAAAEVSAPEASYSFNPVGKRDPFRNPGDSPPPFGQPHEYETVLRVQPDLPLTLGE